MHWTYKTRVGTFWIKPDGRGRFELGVDSEALGNYISPEQAADDVYMCATGHYEWDQQGSVDDPTDLSEWVGRKN